MTREEFEEWIDYASYAFGPYHIQWTASYAHYYEALKEYSSEELTKATDDLYISGETTYLLEGNKLLTLIPTIDRFEKVILLNRVKEALIESRKNKVQKILNEGYE